MPFDDPSEPSAKDNAAAEEKAAGVALVPLNPAAPRSGSLGWRRSPDAGFVTHLMACHGHAPQTRRLRRASAADAQSAYRTRQTPAPSPGRRMQQVI